MDIIKKEILNLFLEECSSCPVNEDINLVFGIFSFEHLFRNTPFSNFLALPPTIIDKLKEIQKELSIMSKKYAYLSYIHRHLLLRQRQQKNALPARCPRGDFRPFHNG